mgnify:CR=1 FL=1
MIKTIPKTGRRFSSLICISTGNAASSLAGMAASVGLPAFIFVPERAPEPKVAQLLMFGATVFNLDDEHFEHPMAEHKARKGYKADTEMTADDWKELAGIFKEVFKKQVGFDFPQDVYKQLEFATKAVFESWNGKRAKAYRRIEGIPDEFLGQIHAWQAEIDQTVHAIETRVAAIMAGGLAGNFGSAMLLADASIRNGSAMNCLEKLIAVSNQA